MCMMCSVAYSTAGVGLAMATTGMPVVSFANSGREQPAAEQRDMSSLVVALEKVAAPSIEEPKWLKDVKAKEAKEREKAESQNASRSGTSKTVTYDVSTKGSVRASLAEFRNLANQTLNDPRGWARMGVEFKEVASGGMFTLVLSEASQLPAFSPGCGAEYSCRAGRFVIINQDRWLGATPSWNNAGGSLRDYRHMVVNHETGHWLGHGHSNCLGAGQPAQVMQQQSIDLQGCKFNPWPVASELTSSQLGI